MFGFYLECGWSRIELDLAILLRLAPARFSPAIGNRERGTALSLSLERELLFAIFVVDRRQTDPRPASVELELSR